MYILLFIVNIVFGVWLSLEHSWWTYFFNISFLVIATCGICTSTVQALATGRTILLGHLLGFVFALIAFREHLIILPIWLILQIGTSFYCAWEDGLIGQRKYKHARANWLKVRQELKQLRKQREA